MIRWIDRMVPHMLFCLTTLLVLFGLVMVYSSSAFRDYRRDSQKKWEEAVELAVVRATERPGHSGASDPNESIDTLREQDAIRRASMLNTFLKQIVWVLLGFVALAFAASVDYPLWGRRIGWLMLLVLGLQAALFVIPANTGLPVQSRLINGSRSWLEILKFRLQPSEIAKIGLILFSSWYLARRVQKGSLTLVSTLPALPVLALSVGLILCESDKGVAVHLCLSLLLLWLLAAGDLAQVLLLGGLSTAAIGAVVATSEEARSRIIHYFTEDSFQMLHAKEAFSRGGFLGKGLGDGDAALSAYLFGAHNDFIFAVVGEELGFITTSLLVAGYLALVLLGLKVAAGCTDPFGTFLALGITILIGAQAFLNMAIVTGLAPTTGFTLPLVSYGGSSLTWTMIAMGILINISMSTHNHLLRGVNRVKPEPFGGGRMVL